MIGFWVFFGDKKEQKSGEDDEDDAPEDGEAVESHEGLVAGTGAAEMGEKRRVVQC